MNAAEFERIARRVWGTPNKALSNGHEMRFGAHGSKAIDLRNLTWFDHESGKGGGYQLLCERAGEPVPTDAGNAIVATYDYRDEAGALLFQVVRKAPKRFLQRRADPAAKDGWAWNTKGVRRVLYRLPELLAADPTRPVFIAEGEKDADNLRALGLTATTNPGGAGKWRRDYAAHLAGRDVVVLPDNDQAGRDHAERVRQMLAGTARAVRIVALPGLAEKGDVSDWAAGGGTAEALLSLVAVAPDAVRASANGNGHADHAGAVEINEVDAAAEIARLAQLPPLRYARSRVASAKLLAIPTGWLDKLVGLERGDTRADTSQGEALDFPDPEPWPDPVDGFSLVYDMRDLMQRHVILPVGGGWAIAVWCLHTFLLGITEHTPRLAVVSPERGCGKTTLLDLLGRLVWRPLLAANLSAAATFRVIARHHPSLMVDEADSFLRDNEELRGVLNAGHRYDGYVLRVVGEDMEPRKFSVFGPVAIALIGYLPGTLADRSITIRMRRAGMTETVEPIRRPSHEIAAELVRKAHRWAADHREHLADAEPAMPARMWNRVADNWRPLFAIAERIGGGLPGKLTEAAEALLAQGAADPQTRGVMLLQDIRAVFQAAGEHCDRLGSAAIVSALIGFEERPWGGFGKGDKPLTQRRLADMLRQFGIISGTHRTGEGTSKGYLRAQFEDAWGRYLDAEPGQ